MLSPGLGLGHNMLETHSHTHSRLGEATPSVVTRMEVAAEAVSMGASQTQRTPVHGVPDRPVGDMGLRESV